MRFPPLKQLTRAVSKATNLNFNLPVIETPKYLTTFKPEVVYKKFNDINRWYTKIIGLDEVKLFQDRVFDFQQKLLDAQEKRREIGSLLIEIRKKSNELQDRIHKVKRQDDLQQFLDLMKEETEILKEEKHLSEMFQNHDREEREIFSAFTNAIRDSHEKQRAQLEYTKYFGIILSIAGSFLAFMYSSLKKNDLKVFIEKHLQATALNPQYMAAPVSSPVLENIQKKQKDSEGMMKAMLKTSLENRKNESVVRTMLEKVERNQKNNEEVMKAILRNHQQLLHAVHGSNKQLPLAMIEETIHPVQISLNEMPDGKKLLWFSVISLVGLMILKKLFN